MKIAISSGHGLKIRGAAGYLDEVDEARKVVNRVTELLLAAGVWTVKFHDDTSTTQSQNLNTIVAWHNKQSRDHDVSVHFNAYQTTNSPRGCEVLYVTQQKLAADTSAAIARAGGFIDRGAKKRTDLAFLNGTNKPAVLLEVCFVDSSADTAAYKTNFEAICVAIAETIGGVKIGISPPINPPSTSRPVLKRGSKGEEVKTVQYLLSVTADGDFGPITERAVKEFQSVNGLTADGIVGPMTWAELDKLDGPYVPPAMILDQTDIKTSVFGGDRDPNNSAYSPYDKITDIEISCALPWRFTGTRPLVRIRNRANHREATCEIRDIGPWLTDDPYWDTGERPLAETCANANRPLPRGPHEGKVPNGCGLDITPAAAKAIGLSGMGRCDWGFISAREQEEA